METLNIKDLDRSVHGNTNTDVPEMPLVLAPMMLSVYCQLVQEWCESSVSGNPGVLMEVGLVRGDEDLDEGMGPVPDEIYKQYVDAKNPMDISQVLIRAYLHKDDANRHIRKSNPEGINAFMIATMGSAIAYPLKADGQPDNARKPTMIESFFVQIHTTTFKVMATSVIRYENVDGKRVMRFGPWKAGAILPELPKGIDPAQLAVLSNPSSVH